MKEKHNVDVVIKKKDVLESGTEYEITVLNQDIKNILSDEQSTKIFSEDHNIENYQLLNDLNINDIETFVKSNPFILVDNDLKTSTSQEHHQNHFDDFKLIDFPVM
jgi:hypothetical protein